MVQPFIVREHPQRATEDIGIPPAITNLLVEIWDRETGLDEEFIELMFKMKESALEVGPDNPQEG